MRLLIGIFLSLFVAASAVNAGKSTANGQTRELGQSKDTGLHKGDEVRVNTQRAFSRDIMAYVEGNVLATFYHEFGHALIDQLGLPIYAREEDAADNFALILTEALHDRLRAEQITWASADQYLQLYRMSKGDAPDFADTHSLDMVRYYTLICLYYGGSPTTRKTFAEENNLPEDRADFCTDERQQADAAWGQVLDDIERRQDGADWMTIRTVDPSTNEYVIAAQQVIRDSVEMLNRAYAPDITVNVDMVDCDEDNAFYDSAEQTIIMCNEYIVPLVRSYSPM